MNNAATNLQVGACTSIGEIEHKTNEEEIADGWRLNQPFKDMKGSFKRGEKIHEHNALGYGVLCYTDTGKYHPFHRIFSELLANDRGSQ